MSFDVSLFFAIVVGCPTRWDRYAEFISTNFGMAFFDNEVKN